MSVFNVHVPAGRYSREHRKKIADSLAQSLADSFGLPVED
ncbi:phenylpyruvate tautomerase PptA (4-oxalocrotonate tautomerase family) [Paraburkholderia silvatlantica]|uniref:Phenylpyruvate tautomerase PptA (4-oxalocrotonate tautomerase family) n=1 Tax=Paraburkholderia silvatlantica TaxID=321895 RepID=A0ABR6FX81_9BURK|nr:phenylpyruvate tautomerase PptA (4-oxalocrotonate tautomerase family) [Paraburkholderia silvatlantica]PVY24663.1 hypothetical protein C7411_12752 [Paraburkholderia silvatlantica]PXW31159.1 hypothetical protein C7413_12652 [Paraburkholderia silvatlantica]